MSTDGDATDDDAELEHDEPAGDPDGAYADLERRARALAEASDHAGAVALGVRELGDEIYAFIASRSRDEDTAGEVFAQACADLVASMPTFQWRCSLRTWFYRLARAAAVRYLRQPIHQDGRRASLSEVSEIVDHVRTRTRIHQRSEVKDGFRKLRDQLDDDEKQLLLLRVDRDLAWNEIAEILEDTDDPKTLKRAAARLRQRFQTLKERLRELAIAEGLIPPG